MAQHLTVLLEHPSALSGTFPFREGFEKARFAFYICSDLQRLAVALSTSPSQLTLCHLSFQARLWLLQGKSYMAPSLRDSKALSEREGGTALAVTGGCFYSALYVWENYIKL